MASSHAKKSDELGKCLTTDNAIEVLERRRQKKVEEQKMKYMKKVKVSKENCFGCGRKTRKGNKFWVQ